MTESAAVGLLRRSIDDLWDKILDEKNSAMAQYLTKIHGRAKDQMVHVVEPEDVKARLGGDNLSIALISFIEESVSMIESKRHIMEQVRDSADPWLMVDTAYRLFTIPFFFDRIVKAPIRTVGASASKTAIQLTQMVKAIDNLDEVIEVDRMVSDVLSESRSHVGGRYENGIDSRTAIALRIAVIEKIPLEWARAKVPLTG